MSISKIHDALRDMGIVPEKENTPLVACSTDWRNKLTDAFGWIGDDEDRVYELEREVRYLEGDIGDYESLVTDLKDKVEKLTSERDVYNDELGRALSKLKLAGTTGEAVTT